MHYAQRAAEWARARHAYARAADYYERALAVLDLEPDEPHRYAELLLALGHTQFVAGTVDATIATLERTFELTRAHGYYDLFCQAILIWFQLRQDTASVDPAFHARINEALEHVQERDTVFAQLQVARAMATMFTSPTSERVQWIREALDLTRTVADLRPRLEVLRGALRCYINFTEAKTNLEIAEEMLLRATALRSPENELEALHWRAAALLELGRGSDHDNDVAAYRHHATIVTAPQAAWTARVLHAAQLFRQGSLRESESVAREAGKVGQELVGLAGFGYMLTQLFQVGMEYEGVDAQRVLHDFIEGGNRLLAVAPTFHALIAALARARARCGQTDVARDYLARVNGPNYTPPDPLDRNFLNTMVSIADLACTHQDVAGASVVSQILEPYQTQHATAGMGAGYMGPVSYWLGRLSLVRGRAQNARQQLTLAVSESEHAGSVIYRAWSEYYLAQTLAARETPLRMSLVESARQAAQRHGLGRLHVAIESDQRS